VAMKKPQGEPGKIKHLKKVNSVLSNTNYEGMRLCWGPGVSFLVGREKVKETEKQLQREQRTRTALQNGGQGFGGALRFARLLLPSKKRGAKGWL